METNLQLQSVLNRICGRRELARLVKRHEPAGARAMNFLHSDDLLTCIWLAGMLRAARKRAKAAAAVRSAELLVTVELGKVRKHLGLR